jgi:hypothetical protein
MRLIPQRDNSGTSRGFQLTQENNTLRKSFKYKLDQKGIISRCQAGDWAESIAFDGF